jgi:histidinol dehydrogenase
LVNVEQYIINTGRDAERAISKIRDGGRKMDFTVSSKVAKILGEIRESKDAGLIRLIKRFDSKEVKSSKDLEVRSGEMRKAYSKISEKQIIALKTLAKQIAKIASFQMRRFGPRKTSSPLGFSVEERYVPFDRIGGYVPGGLASYPSTVLMICVTAVQAGVKDIVLATPPRKDGSISESVLVAADICGVSEIIKAGGAQAIGALAYGTETIKKVDVIAGPGNQYVTEAKRQVSSSGKVLIDSLAGPTELLIIADKTADPVLVAEDLISQAEHGNRTICGVVSDAPSLIKEVAPRLKDLSMKPRLPYIEKSILFTARVPNRSKMIEFAQKFASEHLEVMLTDSRQIDSKLTNSGLVLVGDFTPCSSTDYIVGTNHVLPTGGTATVSAGLGVENFLKRVTVVRGSRSSLGRASGFVSTLANMESLPNHAAAVDIRFRK